MSLEICLSELKKVSSSDLPSYVRNSFGYAHAIMPTNKSRIESQLLKYEIFSDPCSSKISFYFVGEIKKFRIRVENDGSIYKEDIILINKNP